MLLQVLQSINSSIKWISVQRGTLLQQAGGALHGLYFIKEGHVSVLVRPKDGLASGPPLSGPNPSSSLKVLSRPMRQVALLGPRDFFGEDALLSAAGGVHQVRSSTILSNWWGAPGEIIPHYRPAGLSFTAIVTE